MTASLPRPVDWPDLAVLLAALAVAFAATVVATRPLIGWLRANQYGKAIREDGPDHAAKSGTPTMGGLAALGVMAAGGVIIAWWLDSWLTMAAVAIGMAGFALLGLVDDLAGLARRSGEAELGVGLTARRMFAAQVVVAVVACGALLFGTLPGGAALVGLAISALIVVGIVNGVNMSDGLDGLAAGLCAIAFAAMGLALASFSTINSAAVPRGGLYAIATAIARPLHALPQPIGAGTSPPRDVLAVAAFCFVVSGTCLGFLVYNRHPAQVFMGNVTSMALGGGLALAALASGMGLILLPIIAAVFVLEVVSVIVQVGYYKASGGRRVFRMAPIHHHFELGGLSETAVVRRFWAAGLVAGLIGVMIAAGIAGGI